MEIEVIKVNQEILQYWWIYMTLLKSEDKSPLESEDVPVVN